jgi:hypothetical protein
MEFNPLLHMCTLSHKPAIIKGLWVLAVSVLSFSADDYSVFAQIAFELFIFSMVCLNALNRPRGSHIILMKVLYRDGICFFLVSLQSMSMVFPFTQIVFRC